MQIFKPDPKIWVKTYDSEEIEASDDSYNMPEEVILRVYAGTIENTGKAARFLVEIYALEGQPTTPIEGGDINNTEKLRADWDSNQTQWFFLIIGEWEIRGILRLFNRNY